MWRGPYYNHWFLGAQIISIFLNIFPSLAEAEKDLFSRPTNDSQNCLAN
jgi:hypothetical protein